MARVTRDAAEQRASLIEEAKWWQREADASAAAARYYRSAQMRNTACAVQINAAKYANNAQALVQKLIKGGMK